MQRIIHLLFYGWLSLFSLSCITDSENITFVNETTGSYGNKIQSTLKIKGNKWRYDIPSEQTSVIVTNDHQYAIVNHQTKMISYVDIDQLGKQSGLDKKALDDIKKGLRLEFSGKKQKILGWDCEEYVILDVNTKISSQPVRIRSVAWIAPDYPDGERLQAIVEQTYGGQSMAETFGERISLPGFAIKSETLRDGTTVTTNQYIAINEGEIPDSTFVIPANYAISIAK
ncbi:hypothetical protein GCM10028808_39660 [Spirosoma migulaei]